MIGSIRRPAGLDRSTAGVVATTLAIQASLVFTGIVSARVLGPEDRGWLALAVAIVYAVSGVVLLGFPSAITFEIASGRDRGFDSLHALRRSVVVQLVLGAAVASGLVLWLYGGSSQSVAVWVAVAGIGALCSMAIQYLTAVLQGRGGFASFNVARAVPQMIYTASVVLIMGFLEHPGASMFAIGWLVAMLIAPVVAWWLTRRDAVAGRGGDADIGAVKSYGIRSFLGVRSPLETMNVDQVVIGAIGGPVVLGYYVVATALSNLPRFMAESVGMVAFPKVASASGHDRQKRAREALTLTVLISASTVAPMAVAASWIVPWLFGESFRPAVDVTRIMLAAAFLLSLRRILGDLLRGFGSPTPSSVAEVVSIVVFSAAVGPLTLLWGAEGAATAYALAAFGGTMLVTLAYRENVRKLRASAFCDVTGEE